MLIEPTAWSPVACAYENRRTFAKKKIWELYKSHVIRSVALLFQWSSLLRQPAQVYSSVGISPLPSSSSSLPGGIRHHPHRGWLVASC